MNAPINNDNKVETGTILHAALIAGLGGTLPTLSAVAGSVAANPTEIDLISFGHIAAMALYYVLGFILCFGLRERRLKESFILGIAAPAIVMNLISGATSSSANDEQVAFRFSIISTAYASTHEPRDDTQPSQFITDLKRGLGFNVELIKVKRLLEEKSEEVTQQSSELEELRYSTFQLTETVNMMSPECKPALSFDDANINKSALGETIGTETPNEVKLMGVGSKTNPKVEVNSTPSLPDDTTELYAHFGATLIENSSLISDLLNMHQLEFELHRINRKRTASEIYKLKQAIIINSTFEPAIRDYITRAFDSERRILLETYDRKTTEVSLLEQEWPVSGKSFVYDTEVDVVNLINTRNLFLRAAYSYNYSPTGERYTVRRSINNRKARLEWLASLYRSKYSEYL